MLETKLVPTRMFLEGIQNKKFGHKVIQSDFHLQTLGFRYSNLLEWIEQCPHITNKNKQKKR